MARARHFVLLKASPEVPWDVPRNSPVPEAPAAQAPLPSKGPLAPTPLALRLAWYKDMVSIFNEYNIAWANWDYKGGFAPVYKNGFATEIVPVILE